MRRLLPIFLVSLFSVSISAQNFLAFDIYRPFGMKRIHYYPKDKFSCKVKGSKKKYSGVIQLISDSNLILSSKKHTDTVEINKIRMVLVDRSNYLTRSFQHCFYIAGPGIIALDSFNNLINSESQIVKPRVVKTGIGLVISGLLLKLYETKRHRIGKRKILKVMNTSIN